MDGSPVYGDYAGLFAPTRANGLRDVTDGTSGNTVAVAEVDSYGYAAVTPAMATSKVVPVVVVFVVVKRCSNPFRLGLLAPAGIVLTKVIAAFTPK
ncbi:MAG: hypothetical protein U0894_18075 [Pirellulales bacterium]